jgi:thioredoxin-related protein
MKKVILISGFALLPLFCASLMAATPQHTLEAGMVNPGYVEKPSWFKLSLLELQVDVAEAAAAGKRVILYFYQDGCPYCTKLLEDNFGNQQIAAKAKQKFDLIALNMWGDREVVDLKGNETIEKEFASSMKVMYTPTMLFLNEKGEVVLRINGYYYPQKFSAVLDYVSAGTESKMTFADYYKTEKKSATSGKLHIDPAYLQPPYNLKQRLATAKRPLVVMFEEPNCKLCDELHLDILQKAESREAIKAFDVVLLNQHSKGFLVTPEGVVMKIADWANQLNIQHSPSLVFFDTTGKEVFRTEAYLRTFHIAGAMNYVSSGKYKSQPSFQRYLQEVNKNMTNKGIKVDLLR